MKVGSLFSGGGLGDLGLEMAGMEIAFQVEIDDYCRKILQLRWPNVPKWGDIRDVRAEDLPAVDMLAGGFPCQPVSIAGNRKGDADERWLWPEYFRLICEIKPRWVLVENVPGLLSAKSGRLFGGILRDLASCGYGVEWDCIPASAVGAPHQRDRVWIVAHAEHDGCAPGKKPIGVGSGINCCQTGKEPTGEPARCRCGECRTNNVADAVCGRGEKRKTKHAGESNADGCRSDVANAEGDRCKKREQLRYQKSAKWLAGGGQTLADAPENRRRTRRQDYAEKVAGGRESDRSGVESVVSHSIFAGRQGHELGVLEIENERRRNSDPAGSGWWSVEPSVGRVVDGCPRRVDRLKLLGNGQVVPLVAWIGRKIMEYES